MVGCRKDCISTKDELKVDENLVFKTPTTPEELQLAENLNKITSVFKELYKEKANLKVVNAAIYAKVYTDESVLLCDLIYPDNSAVALNQKFLTLTSKWGISLKTFSNNFWTEVNKKNDPAFKAFLNNLENRDSYSMASTSPNLRSAKVAQSMDVSIYYPYSDNYATPCLSDVIAGLKSTCPVYEPPLTTIVSATADADAGIGNQPVYVNGILSFYKQVVVNDDYAYNNATQIIGINGIEPYATTIIPTNSTFFPPSDPIDLPELNIGRQVRQVYIGDVRCSHQYDHLISFTGNGGGSEIRFTRCDGYLKVTDGQVQADNFVVDGKDKIVRKDIRNNKWLEWSAQWDGDWEPDNTEQLFAIYEEDNRNSSSVTGTLKTTIKPEIKDGDKITIGIPIEGTIGFTLNYKSDDAIIRQTILKYSSFFALNRVDLEGEMHNGWPVYDKNGTVSYTLWDRTIY
jgi:hypothetical protein